MKKRTHIGTALALAALIAATGCGSEGVTAGGTTENTAQTAQADPAAAPEETQKPAENETVTAPEDAGNTTVSDAGNTAETGTDTDTSAADEGAQDETAAPEGEEAEAGATETATSAVTADALYSQITSGVALPQMFLADSSYAENFLGLDMTKVAGFVFATAEDVTRVDSVILIEATDEAAAGAVAGLLENFRAQKAAETDPAGGGYQPELHDDIVASSTGQSGKYVWLVVSPDRTAIEGIIAAAWK